VYFDVLGRFGLNPSGWIVTLSRHDLTDGNVSDWLGSCRASAAGTPMERSPGGGQRDLVPHPDRCHDETWRRGGRAGHQDSPADRRCRLVARLTAPGQRRLPAVHPAAGPRCASSGAAKDGPARAGPGHRRWACSSAANRAYLRRHGIKTVMRVKGPECSPAHAWEQGSCQPAFDPRGPQHRRGLP
jgi:hypothetical protein